MGSNPTPDKFLLMLEIVVLPGPSQVLQWRNRLAHGTYRQYSVQRYAGVVSSSLTWSIPHCFDIVDTSRSQGDVAQW